MRTMQTWAAEQMIIKKTPNIYGLSTRKEKGGHVQRAFKSEATESAVLDLAKDERFYAYSISSDGQPTAALAFGLLGNSQISRDGFGKLQQIPSLELDLSERRMSDDEIAELAKLTNLRSLRMSNTSIDDTSIASLSGLVELRELGLSQTDVSDAGVKKLSPLTKLHTLWMADSQITDAGLKHLKAFPALVELDLHGTQVTDSGLPTLAALPQLRRLNIQGTHISKPAALAFAKKHPKMLLAH